MSHYDPPLGGPNCYDFRDGYCYSGLNNGERWETYYHTYDTISCPKELGHGTVLEIMGREFTCRDTGTKIVYENGVYWVDVLGQKPLAPFGTEVDAYIKLQPSLYNE